MGSGVITTICILLFIGATGKSAQIPLYVWLPDAMEGPTPVSALIHAATMVTAGVYMVARSNALFALSPTALALVAGIGAATAIWAASIGLVQNDIKRVLAYSTVSQLGYMFLACGVGAFTAGIFHLMTHAFFKALLFLGFRQRHPRLARRTGHAQNGRAQEQDSDHVLDDGGCGAGDLRDSAALQVSSARTKSCGNPLPDLTGTQLLWTIGWITAGLTAFYMFRLIFMTFWGESRVPHDVEHHIHESPRPMLIPLVTLAILSIVGGFIGWPKSLMGRRVVREIPGAGIRRQSGRASARVRTGH